LLNQKYGFASRLLHRVALGSTRIRQASFELEKNSSAKGPCPKTAPPVFISGLARSGSSILMQVLFSTGDFRSLTYSDMPFVLMPGIWRRISSPFYRDGTSSERTHGDGLEIDLHSPEAFEEVFWLTFLGQKYIKNDCLIPHAVGDITLSHFKQYVSSVQMSCDRPGELRYLSKNNNNILRLPALVDAFPDSVILITFRNPIQQAFSLLEQHRHFSKIQREDPFAKSYMGWLGHYEFGLLHRPFTFNQSVCEYSPDNINYWLSQWLQVYRHVLNTAPVNTIYLCHENLCHHPEMELENLLTKLNISTPYSELSPGYRPVKPKDVPGCSEQLQEECMALYSSLNGADKLS
jgi:hypothetical protein